MPNEQVEQKQEPSLLSTEKLKADNEALQKRVTALEKQVNDMIKELSSGSYTIKDDTDGSKSSNKENLQERLNKVFGNGKID